MAKAVSGSSGSESCWTPRGTSWLGGSSLVLGLVCECTGLGDGAGFWGRGVHAVVIMLVFRV